MKKLLLVLITSLALMSCGRDEKSVRLSNGALIQARNTTDIHYGIGSKVCVRRSSSSLWEICNDGEIKDTIYAHTYKQDGVNRTFVVTHKTGLVSSHL